MIKKRELSNEGCIRLVGVIIKHFVKDLSDPKKEVRERARGFFYSEDFDFYCTSLGASPEYIRKQIKTPDGLAVMPATADAVKKEGTTRLSHGALKKMSRYELKKYQSDYRKNRRKKMTMQESAAKNATVLSGRVCYSLPLTTTLPTV